MRTVLSGNVTFHARPDVANNSGDGLSYETAVKDPQEIVYRAYEFDFFNHHVTLQCDAPNGPGGPGTGGLAEFVPPSGNSGHVAFINKPFLGGGSFTIVGNTSSPDSFLFKTEGSDGDAVKIDGPMGNIVRVYGIAGDSPNGSIINHSGFGEVRTGDIVLKRAGGVWLMTGHTLSHLIAEKNTYLYLDGDPNRAPEEEHLDAYTGFLGDMGFTDIAAKIYQRRALRLKRMAHTILDGTLRLDDADWVNAGEFSLTYEGSAPTRAETETGLIMMRGQTIPGTGALIGNIVT